MANWSFLFLILTLIAPNLVPIDSIPIQFEEQGTTVSNYRRAGISFTETTENYDATTGATFSRNDYAVSDQEYRNILIRLRAEAEELANSRNYVPDDASMEDILRLISDTDTSTTTSGPNMNYMDRFATEHSGHNITGAPDLAYIAVETESPRSSDEPNHTGNPDCAVCLEPMDKSERAVTLLCGHEFHLNCIRRWKFQVTLCKFHRSDNSLSDSTETITEISAATAASQNDYVVGEQEYPNALDGLREEAEGRVADNPRNYALNDASMEDILRLIVETESPDSSSYRQDHTGNHGDCPVCLEPMDESERFVTLKCGHKFHLDCTKRWKSEMLYISRSGATCPLCRSRRL